MVKLENALDTRNNKWYSVAIVKDKDVKYFIADSQKPIENTEAVEIVEILTGGLE